MPDKKKTRLQLLLTHLLLLISFLFNNQLHAEPPPISALETQELADKKRFAPLLAQLDSETQVRWLHANHQPFLGLFTPSLVSEQKGACIIVTDAGQHPDWPGPVKMLRHHLPLHGWATLSLALPPHHQGQTQKTKTKDFSFPVAPEPTRIEAQALARLESAFAELNDQGLYNIVIIAIGTGAQLSAFAIKNVPKASFAGFIAISPRAALESRQSSLTEDLTAISAPVLEILPAQFSKGNTQTAALLAIKKQHPQYTQVILRGSNKQFKDDHLLLPRIRGWLKRHATGVRATKGPIKAKY
ncbi:MAG: alpha/beta hydrolase family protein [Gammaproteobacteria bacterium]|nr:alpha/beta hydrolase family protein [Gammaproteobacteria bacterium]